MIEPRIAKVVMVACLAALALLVTFDNVTDYETNYAFVRHVLSMDTTFPQTALVHRRITSPALWQAAFAMIILGEGLTGLGLAVRQLRRAGECGQAAPALIGPSGGRARRLVGFLVWFFGFMVVGGEWLAMWQSEKWDAREGAFRFYLTILVVLIYVDQADDDLRPRSKSCG